MAHFSKKSQLPGGAKSTKLVNNLTIEDAIHLMRNEGGELTAGRAAMRILIVCLIAGFTAKAILYGEATSVHLSLPMIAEYLALLIALPPIYFICRYEGMRKDAVGGLVLLVVFAIALAIYVAVQASKQQRPWPMQASMEWNRLVSWIVDHDMHWPMLGAAASVVFALPGRIGMLLKHGPPFFAVGLGCGARVVILLFGIFLIPWIAGSSARITWALWAVLFLAEIFALVMVWDIQKRLRKAGIPF